MLEWILAQQTAVQAVISQRNARSLMLPPTDITLIEFIHIKPLAEDPHMHWKCPFILMVQLILAEKSAVSK